MTDDELAKLEALAQAATPGPWHASHYEGYGWRVDADEKLGIAIGEWREPDADFIAAARSAVPDLCKEVRRLREVDQRLRESTGELYSATLTERDALRAENERLRAELADSERVRKALITSAYQVQAEAAELRASLADAVAKIAAMEPVVEAARAYVKRSGVAPRHVRVVCEADIERALDAYEASLPASPRPRTARDVLRSGKLGDKP